ncbi:MAG: hypothetical protein R2932_14770 [Caldilineaceae bacterium]
MAPWLVSAIWRRDGQWTTYTTANGLASNVVMSLAVEQDGTVWAGLQDAGVSKRTPDGMWTTKALPNYDFDSPHAIAIDSANNKWFAFNAVGVLRLAADGGETLFTTADGLASDRVNAIAFDQNDDAWFGTFSGVTSRTAAQPGQGCADALPLPPNVNVSGQLTGADDTDVYTFDIDASFSRCGNYDPRSR